VHGSKGAAIHVRELCRALASLDHAVNIFALRTGGPAPAHFDVPVCEFVLEPLEQLTYDLLRADRGAGESVAKVVRALLAVNSLRHAAITGLRDFQPDVIYERYALFGTAGVALARDLQVPLILEVNAPLSDEQAAHRGLALTETARGLECMILRSADQVIAVSHEIERWLLELGVAPQRVMVLPNAVDAAHFEVAERERNAVRTQFGLADQPVVGFLGTLKPWHGTETLLHAIALLRRRGLAPHLVVVGDGPQRAQLEAVAEREGITEAVTFVGAVPHEHVPPYLAAMDVAVAPYDQVQNFYFSPLKLFEYMAAGRPVVAADTGQIRDYIRHGETGLLYPPGGVAALAEAIGTLLIDSTLASSLGRAGQVLVAAEHTWQHRATQILAAAAELSECTGVLP
jgi:glycosyltransferase involved in cell wall biosynthesis